MIGTKLAHFTVTAHLGSGGMGDVYQATDSKLGRSVAIKLLPEAFTHDTERAARFEREARVLASLNHPSIAAIHGIEESGGRKFLVMELVPGETLAERIKRGPIPVNEALDVAKQIAEALEAAHDNEKAIIHRDLKPANVKITPDGKVKVLDFGLAKAYEAQSANASVSNSPTISMAATIQGVILGTAAYMSPEQAKGQEADRTMDVWAFGCVLYEMITGRAAFEGETIGEVLAGVFKGEPDWRRLPEGTPENVRRLLLRCLNKDRRERLQCMGDARIQLEEAEIAAVSSPERPLTRSVGRYERAVWVSVVVLIAAAGFLWTRRSVPNGLASSELRLDITTPASAQLTVAISPDGSKVTFPGLLDGRSLLWVRSLDATTATPLQGTDGGFRPFWSPDGKSLGFFADGNLKRLDIESGVVRTLAPAPAANGGSWNSDGVILFGSNTYPLSRIPASGGDPVPVVRQDSSSRRVSQQFPSWIGNGVHFLYYDVAERAILVGGADGKAPRRLVEAESAAATSSQVFFIRQGVLYAQAFDEARLELTGTPARLAEKVEYVSVSTTGTIAYRNTPVAGGVRQLVWFDRAGKELSKVGDPFTTSTYNPELSSDGRRLALTRVVNGNTDIWLLDLSTSRLTRFTEDLETDNYPIWSPDGNRVVFSSFRLPHGDLYEKSATGVGNEALLLESDQNKISSDWSSDGRFILYRSNDPRRNFDIWALPMDRSGKAFPIVQSDAREHEARFSPDGQWIAYQSNESGRDEIYVQAFPSANGRWQVSDGGTQVRWRRDGMELYYIATDARLMAVPIQLPSGSRVVQAGTPVPLFATNVGVGQGNDRAQYAVSADAQRFLINTVADEVSAPITLILNWKPKP